MIMVAATALAVIAGCDVAFKSLNGAADVAVPDHYFIPADPGPSTSVFCPMVADLDSWPEIWQRPLSPCTLDFGWDGLESWGTWVIKERAQVTINLRETDWDRLTVHAEAYDGLPNGVDQEMVIAVNGREVGTVDLARSWREYDVDVPDAVLNIGKNTVTLAFAHRASPTQAGRSADRRLLAARFKSLELTRTNRGFGQRKSENFSQVFDAASDRFVMDRPGTLVIPTEVPRGSTHIVFDVERPNDSGEHQTTVTSTVRSLDGRFFSETVIEGRTTDGQRGNQRSIPTGDATGGFALVTFEVSSLPPGARIALSPLRPMPASGIGQATQTAVQPDPSANRKPDIVLITLDAARPDHFSFSGYHRLTTPNIDALAENAAVFTNAFALAPYTLCSVPTMITGLSFIDHGVVSRTDVLSADAVTLAESLRAAGYRTAAFTATPNNSVAKGTDQGYDEFFEMWRKVPRGTARDPHHVTHQVIQWLDTVRDTKPLHLQIHYVPPHGPYDPAARFDRFSVPDYSGPCDGGNITIDHIESGAIPADEDCLENVIGLYDGNLAAADDAVGQLLDALRARERWTDTLVLITADHGEAFLEHGRMGHNSTVFDEMLRVPFVLRAPAWMDTSQVDTERLVTLADIVPTLLAAASTRPLLPLEGVDLLGHGPDTEGHDQRYFVAGNTDKPPLLGLRSRRWKLQLYWSGHGALFDLASDPIESTNLRFDDPALFAGLGMLATHRVSMPAVFMPALEDSEITDEDREMLEALGYVE